LWIETHASLLRIRRGSDQATQEGIFMSDKSDASKPAIARIWRGRTSRARADEYEAYNYEVGIKPLIEKAVGVQTFREDRADETEFMTISYWESREAMSSFTGGDPTRIHHLERDPEFLLELPKSVQILEIRASHGRTGGAYLSLRR
jgi:heme-degrading monooxygenase HmoA